MMQSITNEAVTMPMFLTSQRKLEEYVAQCKRKPNKIEHMTDNPNYHKLKAIVDTFKESLAAYNDPQDAQYRKMHLITAVHQLQDGPSAPIWESVSQGTPRIDPNHTILQ